MHKHFFKIKNDIYINDILKILEISTSFFLDSNKTLDALILNTKVIDFVSFNNLKLNELSYFSNKNKINDNVMSGICIVEITNFGLLSNDIIKIPFDNPRLAFSKVLDFYFNKYYIKNKQYKIHPNAIIDNTAIIGNNVNIGPFTLIEEGVVIEDDVYISERVTISKDCKIGKQTFIGSNVFIECAFIGRHVIISPNTVIGKTGFGFTPNKSKTILTPHVGAVTIGNNTHIGSGCTIDRGIIDDTIICNFVMIDNQVHIGHNCFIDDYCILSGQVGLSGSVKLYKGVTIGGDVSIKDNVSIGKNSIIAGASKVFNSFPENSKIGGSPAQDILNWKKLIVSQRLSLKKRKKD